MQNENVRLYESFKTTPAEARKRIEAGRLKGFTDINPMWRFKKLTEEFGPCGIGWKYEIVNQRLEPGHGHEVAAFVDILLYFKINGEWSEGIPGVGGSAFVAQEKNGPHTSDECFKMALTDAIGTACKALGMSADIYFEKDRTKYNATPAPDKDNAEQKDSARKQYELDIEAVKALLETVTDADTANQASHKLRELCTTADSERDGGVLWNRHIKGLGLFYDRVLKAYTPK